MRSGVQTKSSLIGWSVMCMCDSHPGAYDCSMDCEWNWLFLARPSIAGRGDRLFTFAPCVTSARRARGRRRPRPIRTPADRSNAHHTFHKGKPICAILDRVRDHLVRVTYPQDVRVHEKHASGGDRGHGGQLDLVAAQLLHVQLRLAHQGGTGQVVKAKLQRWKGARKRVGTFSLDLRCVHDHYGELGFDPDEAPQITPELRHQIRATRTDYDARVVLKRNGCDRILGFGHAGRSHPGMELVIVHDIDELEDRCMVGATEQVCELHQLLGVQSDPAPREEERGCWLVGLGE
eukprot:6178837-Pleurochrysis_carterae.AAC.1